MARGDEIGSTVEKPKPCGCLIQSVRDRANKWCVVSPPLLSGGTVVPEGQFAVHCDDRRFVVDQRSVAAGSQVSSQRAH